MPTRIPWTFDDGVTTFSLPINPNQADVPGRKRSIGYSSSAAPDGIQIIYEGRKQPQTINVSGVLLEEAHYDFWMEWSGKQNPITITDDLGISFTGIIVEFDPKRSKTFVNRPWKMDFSAVISVLS